MAGSWRPASNTNSGTDITTNTVINWTAGVPQMGIGTATPDSKSVLELASTTQYLLPPRMNTTQKNAITSPATGAIVYDTSLARLQSYDGSNWVSFSPNINSTFSSVFTGPFTSASQTMSYTLLGNVVILTIPAFQGTSTAAAIFTASTAAPTSIRPASTKRCIFGVINSNVNVAGTISMSSAGVITIGQLGMANFTNSSIAGTSNGGGSSFIYDLT